MVIKSSIPKSFVTIFNGLNYYLTNTYKHQI